jgi:hypothetical protein
MFACNPEQVALLRVFSAQNTNKSCVCPSNTRKNASNRSFYRSKTSIKAAIVSPEPAKISKRKLASNKNPRKLQKRNRKKHRKKAKTNY